LGGLKVAIYYIDIIERNGGQKNAYKVLMVKAEEETPLRRFKCCLEVYIK